MGVFSFDLHNSVAHSLLVTQFTNDETDAGGGGAVPGILSCNLPVAFLHPALIPLTLSCPSHSHLDNSTVPPTWGIFYCRTSELTLRCLVIILPFLLFMFCIPLPDTIDLCLALTICQEIFQSPSTYFLM